MSQSEGTPPPARYTRRPGNRVVRRAVLRPETVTLRAPRRRRRAPRPAHVLVLGFAGLILVGTILLSLPFATASGERAALVDALFTATSAVCVTGLIVVDTSTYWSPFGHAVILVLIQLGGFGFMTSSILLFLLLGRRASLRNRIVLGEAMGIVTPGGIISLVRRVAVMTLAVELIGALLLFLRFQREMPLGRALWWGLFHSVSAFNNAGIDLIGGFHSLTVYRDDVWILAVFGLLIVIGGLGYTVLADAVRCHKWRRLTVDTKLALSTTAALLVVGTVVILGMEWNNPGTLAPLSGRSRVANAIFQSISPRTAGFNSLDLSAMHEQTLYFTTALMFVGAASGSTGGGIKVQTFSLLLFVILAALRGREHVVAFDREVPQALVFRALAVALLSIAVVFSVSLLLTVTESARFLDVYFETVSGFGTVGLTTGITPHLSVWGRLLIIATIFIGRLGPLTLALALTVRTLRRRGRGIRYATETVKIG